MLLIRYSEFLVEDFDIGEDEIWPDWSSLKVCHFHPGHAQVMCFVYEGGEKDGKGFRRCPRNRLQEITHAAKKEHDINLLVGVEIEFCIFDDSKGTPEQLPVVSLDFLTYPSLFRGDLMHFKVSEHCTTKLTLLNITDPEPLK